MYSSTIAKSDVSIHRRAVIVVPVIGDRIKELREKRGWSQPDLAHEMGLSTYQYISKWERGVNEPSSTMIIKLAKTLGCTSDYLLGLVHSPQDQVDEIKLSPDEINLVRLWRARRIPRTIRQLLGDPDYIKGITDSSDSKPLVSGKEEGTDG